MTRFCLKGLRVGDEVVEFGSVNAGNFQNLQNIASVVQHSEGVINTVTLIFLLYISHYMSDVISRLMFELWFCFICSNFVAIFFVGISSKFKNHARQISGGLLTVKVISQMIKQLFLHMYIKMNASSARCFILNVITFCQQKH